jgi:hypothetical protein
MVDFVNSAKTSLVVVLLMRLSAETLGNRTHLIEVKNHISKLPF